MNWRTGSPTRTPHGRIDTLRITDNNIAWMECWIKYRMQSSCIRMIRRPGMRWNRNHTGTRLDWFRIGTPGLMSDGYVCHLVWPNTKARSTPSKKTSKHQQTCLQMLGHAPSEKHLFADVWQLSQSQNSFASCDRATWTKWQPTRWKRATVCLPSVSIGRPSERVHWRSPRPSAGNSCSFLGLRSSTPLRDSDIPHARSFEGSGLWSTGVAFSDCCWTT
jgi:hypothetical protein